jgi:branched-subunit amino acid transport protein
MGVSLILLIALVTYASRVVGLVLPKAPARLQIVLDRVPPPLFASLAALSLVDGGAVAPAPTLCAVGGALVVAPKRSLLWVLAGGLVGYSLGAIAF